MRKLTSAAVAMIMVVALYFTLFWGFDGLRILTSPNYGLEDVWRSQFVFAIGSHFGLAPIGLIKLAAFFATLKLAVAAICAVHIVDRFRALAGGKANTEILDAGLMLVVVISIVSVGPAMWTHNADLVREQAVSCCWPRWPPRSACSSAAIGARPSRRPLTADEIAAANGATWFSPHSVE